MSQSVRGIEMTAQDKVFGPSVTEGVSLDDIMILNIRELCHNMQEQCDKLDAMNPHATRQGPSL